MRRGMKALEQLGISPTPWTNTINTEKPFEINSVWDARNGGILTGGYSESLNDARLIAAAPDLYEALYDVVAYCESTHLVPSERFGKVLARVKAALAKAAGESEVER